MNYCDDQTKTTCEIYHAVPILELLPSIQSSLYYYLHFNYVRYFGDKIYDVRVCSKNQKNKLKDLVKEIYYSIGLKNNDKCDVIFCFLNDGYLPLQRKLAKECQSQGLRTGIVRNNRSTFPNFPEFTETFSLPNIFSPQESSTIPLKTEKLIIEQCKYVYSYLEKVPLLGLNPKGYLDLAYLATQVEQQARCMQHLLEKKSAKLVILNNAKDLGETAMQIACTNSGTPSMLILHGFPQRSQYPLLASFVMSYCHHHDDYLRKISSNSSQIRKLGWLEPTITLTENFYTSSQQSDIFKSRGKYNVLFLSQLLGWDVHRCESLVKRLPDIIKSLDKMPEVEIITLRLHPKESNNKLLKTLLAEWGCSKLRISDNFSLIDDLKACDILMAFSSTGLLYAPYLNRKAVEIRDETINSVWGGTVLPSEQVYQIGKEFNHSEFSSFVLESRILSQEEVFYNYSNELKSFSEFLNKTV
jgi:hypothetical protein